MSFLIMDFHAKLKDISLKNIKQMKDKMTANFSQNY